ncbi:MAG: hypothetical protein ACUVR3_12235, partial [Candidatus Roseilinea sp.]|uniref:hypothetical protein n=1 Tax=Candidatus Roseilinea sp. TaxID=2838777 RepID=UPI0040496F22
MPSLVNRPLGQGGFRSGYQLHICFNKAPGFGASQAAIGRGLLRYLAYHGMRVACCKGNPTWL